MSTQTSQPSDLERGMKMLEYLEGGPWPSYVAELRKTKYPIEAYAEGLAKKYTPWLSGSFRVRYVFSGILARRSRDGKFVEIHFRTYVPAGRFYSTSYLRKVVEVAKRYGIGLLELGGNTGALVLNMIAEKADEAVDAIRTIMGSDVGGSGDTFREFYACPGPALCEFALYDTLHAMDYIRSHPAIYRYLNTQMFPYKIKFKFSGCPMDCATANSRADFALIGTWVGAPEVDQGLFRKMVEEGKINPKEIVDSCPSKAIIWDEEKKELRIDGSKCLKAMNCIRRAFPAIKPGKNRKIALLIGAHAQGHFGPKLAKAVALLDSIEEVIPFAEELVNKYMELAPRRHRIGDMIIRRGFKVISEVADKTLPNKPRGTPSTHLRISIGAVLTDDERRLYEDWSRQLVSEYFGGGSSTG
ncbi:sulfite reductase subunit alpha [Vulcanisaeta distributa]|uniref:Dissimilatory sulfite reductase alpha subunit n=1 Tax=Vulcanisaeta distributa (strain DSM 14429 / JCM 11212 / NBRC 100878 / IC-017) TaxID=572478 RepID=E1QPH9_VULDI|nr:sulfite reductase subunit alpha [Vulcanisaeta distributa]ADN51467.1 dissimilatory sulfite reductase alpha subunit [Vulcanisaeta distributa DSM 14429]